MARAGLCLDAQGEGFFGTYTLCPSSAQSRYQQLRLRAGGLYANCSSIDELKLRLSINVPAVDFEVSQGLSDGKRQDSDHSQGACELKANSPEPVQERPVEGVESSKSVIGEASAGKQNNDVNQPRPNAGLRLEVETASKDLSNVTGPNKRKLETQSFQPLGTLLEGIEAKADKRMASGTGAELMKEVKSGAAVKEGAQRPFLKKKGLQDRGHGLSSDEDEPSTIREVSDYELENVDEEHVSLQKLPLVTRANKLQEASIKSAERVFVRGKADGGLRPVYEEVKAWRVEVLPTQSRLSLLGVEGTWIELCEPHKEYRSKAQAFQTVGAAVRIMKWAKCQSKEDLETELKKYQLTLKDLSKRYKELEQIVGDEPVLAKSLLYKSLQETRVAQGTKAPEGTHKRKVLAKGGMDVADSRIVKKKVVESDEDDIPLSARLSSKEFIPSSKSLQLGRADRIPLLTAPSGRPGDSRKPPREERETEDMEREDQDWDGGGLEDSNSDGDDLLGGDTICALCDDGGDLVCCDGPCMRSFHASEQEGCESLNVDPDPDKEFFCQQCESKQHQCYICGNLGSSDPEHKQEVFLCNVALCGHFYHPACVAKALIPRTKGLQIEVLQNKRHLLATSIEEKGRPFQCPLHRCMVCGEKEGSDSKDFDLRLVPCRRCPAACHVGCLPDDLPSSAPRQRVWGVNNQEKADGFSRLMYCRKHVIDPDIGTPCRDHIKWPTGSVKAKRKEGPAHRLHPSASASRSALPLDSSRISKAAPRQRNASKPAGPRPSPVAHDLDPIEDEDSEPEVGRDSIEDEYVPAPPLRLPTARKARKVVEDEDVPTTSSKAPIARKAREPLEDEDVRAPSPRLPPARTAGSTIGLTNADSNSRPAERRHSGGRAVAATRLPSFTNDQLLKTVARVQELCKDKVTKEKVVAKLAVISTCRAERFNRVKINKVQSIANAVQTALQCMQDGGNLQDAYSFCPHNHLRELDRISNHLRVYLAPFIHGHRYTSYGRHFTHVAKLNEIVDRLLPYVDDGDCIVDMCCGSNDFSRILDEKLQAAGKKNCSFKNFDISPPKDTFYFTKADWMSVKAEHPNRALPHGDKLIIGLNPPFGVRARLASQFAQHAADFRPKLIILIVPPETNRPSSEYELLWQDDRLLEGKAFYLPGSVNQDKESMAQWNKTTPPLYLWGRRDLRGIHLEIALREGHLKIDSPSPPKAAMESRPGDPHQLAMPPPQGQAVWEGPSERRRDHVWENRDSPKISPAFHPDHEENFHGGHGEPAHQQQVQNEHNRFDSGRHLEEPRLPRQDFSQDYSPPDNVQRHVPHSLVQRDWGAGGFAQDLRREAHGVYHPWAQGAQQMESVMGHPDGQPAWHVQHQAPYPPRHPLHPQYNLHYPAPNEHYPHPPPPPEGGPPPPPPDMPPPPPPPHEYNPQPPQPSYPPQPPPHAFPDDSVHYPYLRHSNM